MANINLTKLLIPLVILAGVLLILSTNPLSKKEITKVCYRNHCFETELAKTLAEKRRGLSERKNLEENKAMLFSYSREQKPRFWMKDTLISLDIIWLNKEKKVVKIKHRAQPCKNEPCPTFKPEGGSQYVLEIKGGKAKKIGLKQGDKLRFKR